MKSGFTLVETMVAVFILSLTIISLMSVVASSLFASRYSRDEITVNYLLQEAVDFIRNDRDSAVFSYLDAASVDEMWEKFIDKYNVCIEENQGCTIDVYAGTKDPSSSFVKKCDSDSFFNETTCPPFFYQDDSESSIYNYEETGSKTSFRRKIFFKVGDNRDEIMVKATVYWLNGNTVKSRSLQTSLLKW